MNKESMKKQAYGIRVEHILFERLRNNKKLIRCFNQARGIHSELRATLDRDVNLPLRRMISEDIWQ